MYIGKKCEEGEIQLSGDDTENEGRVEICLGGKRGVVCHDEWHNVDATVVCRQLGYSDVGEKRGMRDEGSAKREGKEGVGILNTYLG